MTNLDALTYLNLKSDTMSKSLKMRSVWNSEIFKLIISLFNVCVWLSESIQALQQ